MEKWGEAVDLLTATQAFDHPLGGVEIDNKIIRSVSGLLTERDRYREALVNTKSYLLVWEHKGELAVSISATQMIERIDNALRGGKFTG